MKAHSVLIECTQFAMMSFCIGNCTDVRVTGGRFALFISCSSCWMERQHGGVTIVRRESFVGLLSASRGGCDSGAVMYVSQHQRAGKHFVVVRCTSGCKTPEQDSWLYMLALQSLLSLMSFTDSRPDRTHLSLTSVQKQHNILSNPRHSLKGAKHTTLLWPPKPKLELRPAVTANCFFSFGTQSMPSVSSIGSVCAPI